jgi:uncharacterized protein
MGTPIRITAGPVSALGELSESPTGRAIAAALPIHAEARTWGDEIYFPVPVEQKLDQTAAEVVEMGDLGYWPTGRAFCIFFGPTPASRGDEIRPASAVNVVGRVKEDARIFRSVADGDAVEIRAEG